MRAIKTLCAAAAAATLWALAPAATAAPVAVRKDMTANPIVVDCSAASTGATTSVRFITDTATRAVKEPARRSSRADN